jgi:hypothetical protein
MKDRSEFEPQEKNPKGEVREDKEVPQKKEVSLKIIFLQERRIK